MEETVVEKTRSNGHQNKLEVKTNTTSDTDPIKNIETKNEQEKTETKGTFFPPSMPAPTAIKVSIKKKPVSMAFRKTGVPADIYKAPKIAQFMSTEVVPSVPKPEIKSDTGSKKDKGPPAVLMYEKPTWGKVLPENVYSLEVLKNGSIIDKIKLSGKEYFTIGRLKDCDIPMEHPLISRYHSVLQFGAPGQDAENVELQKDGTSGLYLYDIGSTHGSFLNKVRIPSNEYFRLKVGHMMKFGGSTRMFILQGPIEDQEEVAKESVSELKEMYKKKKQEREDLAKKMLGEDEEEEISRVDKVQSVTWGMGDDAVIMDSSDEDDDDSEKKKKEKVNPFATPGKERFYVKDPVKALKHFYEQERIEISFEYTERRPGHWHARLEMPFDGKDGRAVYAEASVTGKKKDAANSCALEACKLLDQEGFFQQSEHHKKKVKQWKEDDYYDSDEDEFLDRTGEISKKRLQRMKRTGGAKESAAETFETLSGKVTSLETEINDINKQLAKDKNITKVNENSADPLEDFMKQIKSGKALDTVTRSKLKVRLVEARKELAQALRLAEMARPASMPKLQATANQKSFAFIGKMKGKRKLGVQIPQVPKIVEKVEIGQKGDEEEEEDEANLKETSKDTQIKNEETKDIEINETNSLEQPSNNKEPSNESKNNKLEERDKADESEPIIEDNVSQHISKTDNIKLKSEMKYDISATKSSTKRLMGPTLPPELRQKLLEESSGDAQGDSNLEEAEPQPKRRKERGRKQKANPHKPTNNQYVHEGDDKYVTWVPPQNQTGDGTTKLNEKLGY